MPPLCPLPVVDATALTAEAFYEEHVDASMPLVIRDERLRLLKPKWSDAYLEKHGALQVHDEVRLSSDTSDVNFPLTKVAGERSKSQSVRDFLRTYRRPNRTANFYATNLVIPHLREDYARPAFTAPLDHGCASGWCGGLWLGTDSQRSALHRDFAENLHGVIEGAKTFTLFSPNETAALYPRPESASRLGHATRMPLGARTCGGAHRPQPDCGGDGSGDVACPSEFSRFPAARKRALVCTVQERVVAWSQQ